MSTSDPIGVPPLERLHAFIEMFRSRMNNENNNLFAASAGAWWRYYLFLTIILARFDHSNAESVEAFGSFNYGATGAALGFSDQTLLRMAGYAQWRAGTSLPEDGRPWGPFQPYGDDPWDQHWIQAGIKYYRCTHGISGADPGSPSFYGLP